MQPPRYLPSPEVIAAQAAAIRAGWTDAEHYERAGEPLPSWLPPTASVEPEDTRDE